jgi:hypothetical protein
MRKILIMTIAVSLAVLISGCGGRCFKSCPQADGGIIYKDNFTNLDNWHLEGFTQGISIPEQGILRLDSTGSRQGGVGAMAFCEVEFPDDIAIEYDLNVKAQNGLIITFVAMQGLGGQDAITGVPQREGYFADYVGDDATTRSYHVSLSRYNDKAEHTGVSNWRRNPGLHLVGQGDDPCKEIDRRYSIKIVKSGPSCKLYVDGELASEFTDPQEIDDKLPTSGKVGFRAIGSRAIFEVANFKVSAI